MSIQIPIIITPQDFIEFYRINNIPQERIQRAINKCFTICDSFCNNQIQVRWDLTGDNALTDKQKEKIKLAFLTETDYLITKNLDLNPGSQSMSIGDLNVSANNSQFLPQLCEAAKSYLISANIFYSTEFNNINKSKRNFQDSSLVPFGNIETPLTQTAGDIRYLKTFNPNAKNKMIQYNSNGNVEYITELKGLMWYYHIITLKCSDAEQQNYYIQFHFLSKNKQEIETVDQLKEHNNTFEVDGYSNYDATSYDGEKFIGIDFSEITNTWYTTWLYIEPWNNTFILKQSTIETEINEIVSDNVITIK